MDTKRGDYSPEHGEIFETATDQGEEAVRLLGSEAILANIDNEEAGDDTELDTDIMLETPGKRLQEGLLSLEHLVPGDSQGVYEVVAKDYFEVYAEDTEAVHILEQNHTKLAESKPDFEYQIEPKLTILLTVDLNDDINDTQRVLRELSKQQDAHNYEVIVYASCSQYADTQPQDVTEFKKYIQRFSQIRRSMNIRWVIDDEDGAFDMRKRGMDLVGYDALARRFTFDHPVVLLEPSVLQLPQGIFAPLIEAITDTKICRSIVSTPTLFEIPNGTHQEVVTMEYLLAKMVGRSAAEAINNQRTELPGTVVALGPYIAAGGFTDSHIDEMDIFLQSLKDIKPALHSAFAVAKPDHRSVTVRFVEGASKSSILIRGQKYEQYFTSLAQHAMDTDSDIRAKIERRQLMRTFANDPNMMHRIRSIYTMIKESESEDAKEELKQELMKVTGQSSKTHAYKVANGAIHFASSGWRKEPLPEYQDTTKRSIYTISGGLPTLGRGHR